MSGLGRGPDKATLAQSRLSNRRGAGRQLEVTQDSDKALGFIYGVAYWLNVLTNA